MFVPSIHIWKFTTTLSFYYINFKQTFKKNYLADSQKNAKWLNKQIDRQINLNSQDLPLWLMLNVLNNKQN